MKWKAGIFFFWTVASGPALRAQPPSFEAASIKPSDPGHVGAQIYAPGPGRFTAMTAVLKDLMQYAYNVRPSQIVGGAHWTESEALDIAAKAAGSPANGQLRLMVQTLLAERFQLKVRRETRELSVYNLVVDKNGPKLLEEVAAAGIGVGTARGNVHACGADMPTLARVLSGHLDCVVIDRTGLEGFYNFTLTWRVDETDPAGAGLFSAIQELGLKLEAGKAPVDVLVIESAERPSRN